MPAWTVCLRRCLRQASGSARTWHASLSRIANDRLLRYELPGKLPQRGRSNYKPARTAAGKWDTQDFVVCEVQLLELPAAVRAATHRSEDAIPEHIARRVINRFDRAVNRKLFLRKPLDMGDSVSMARSLGDAHGWSKRHTTLDLWHLA